MASKIFINYRRDDSASEALNIAQYFEKTFGKANVFIDIDRLRPGQKFTTVLERTLDQCEVMLVIIGPHWGDARDKSGARRLDNPEDWVRLEIERALARNIPVVPVLLAGTRLPSKRELPPKLQPLVERQYATVTAKGFRHEIAGLARDVGELMPRRSWIWMTVPLLAFIIAACVATYDLGALNAWWRLFDSSERSAVDDALRTGAAQNPNSSGGIYVRAVSESAPDPAHKLIDVVLGNSSAEQILLTKMRAKWSYLVGGFSALAVGTAIFPTEKYNIGLDVNVLDNKTKKEKETVMFPMVVIPPRDKSGPSIYSFRLELFYSFEPGSPQYHPNSDWNILYEISIEDEKGRSTKLTSGQWNTY